MSNVTKDVKLFYSAIMLTSCADQYFQYLIDTEGTHWKTKDIVKWMMRKHEEFRKLCSNGLNPKDRQIWLGELKNRDYMSFSSVFEILAMLDDERRTLLEDVASQILEGNIKAEEDFRSLQRETPNVGDQCFIILQRGIDKGFHVVDATYHNDKLGFYIPLLSEYVPTKQVRGWKRSNIQEYKNLLANETA